MTRDINLLVVGTGFIAQTMIAAIRHVPGLRVTALHSRDGERARRMAASFGIGASHDSLEAALADPALDAVYIANDTAAHAGTAIQALEAGKAVLCEKPLATTAGEAEAIVAAARRTGKLFMEAVATPFVPAVRAALDEVARGSLGTARHVAVDFGYPTTEASHPGCYAAAGGGVLLDRAVYGVTLARIVLGPVDRVRAHVERNADGIDVEASLLLVHANGAASQVTASLTAMLGNTMTIGCTRGAATINAPLLAAEDIAVRTAAEPQRPAPPGGTQRRLKESALVRRAAGIVRGPRARHISFGNSPYAGELAHFRDLHRAGALESPVLPLDLSVDVMCILDSAREAP